MRMAGGEMRMVRRRHGALLLLLAGSAVAWNPKPHHEMAPCYPTEAEACQYIPGSTVRTPVALYGGACTAGPGASQLPLSSHLAARLLPPSLSLARGCSLEPADLSLRVYEQTTWDASTETFTEDTEGGSFGAPLWDSIDVEWDQKFVDSLGSGGSKDIPYGGGVLRDAIVNGEVRIGRTVEGVNGKGDLTLPVPGNHPPGSTERQKYSLPASDGKAFGGNEEYLQMLHPDLPYTRTIYLKDGTEEVEVGPIDMTKAMRSGGFPMCPNYWDWFGGDNPGPLNLGNDDTQDAELYKFPSKVVGSPLVGDPELHFCRKWQEKYDATCCTTYLDEDIQEEYEELVRDRFAPFSVTGVALSRLRDVAGPVSDSCGRRHASLTVD
jgi:hypothetical protein